MEESGEGRVRRGHPVAHQRLRPGADPRHRDLAPRLDHHRGGRRPGDVRAHDVRHRGERGLRGTRAEASGAGPVRTGRASRRVRRGGSASGRRSGQQARSQPRRGQPAHRSCAPASRTGTQPTSARRRRQRRTRTGTRTAAQLCRRPRISSSESTAARAQAPGPGRARRADARKPRTRLPQSREPLPRRHSHIADNAHYVK
jgi:hypothetical protein